MKYNILHIIILLPVLSVFLIAHSLSAQVPEKKNADTSKTVLTIRRSADSTLIKMDSAAMAKYIDSVGLTAPSTTFARRSANSGIDTIVVYSAKDSVVFDIKSKKMKLWQNAKVLHKEQNLQSNYIELRFDESTLFAASLKDSSGRKKGYPKFSEKGEEYVGETLLFNFKTQKGTIALGETKMSEGYYYGEKIKRISQSEMFVRNGCYTTCDAPHPHYYFSSPEMKVALQDRIYLDPLVFYVEDMPVFWLPIGMFFPAKSGRQSGIMIPTYSFTKDRGVVIQDFGVYLALSDYYDTQFKIDYFSKGGFTVKNNTQWALGDILRGSASIQYGMTRFDPDAEYNTNWSVQLDHSHDISPMEKYNLNLNLSSQKFNQNTSTNLFQRIQQNITSRGGYTKTWENGVTTSLSYDRTQNIITDEYTQTLPGVSISMPNYMPLKSSFSPTGSFSWLRNVAIGYFMNGSRSNWRSLKYGVKADTAHPSDYSDDYRLGIQHRPSISVSPKLGYFSIMPSFSFSANNYFRKLSKSFVASDSSVFDAVENGIFTEYWYSFGVGLSTRLFGIAKPKLFGVNAVRHTFQPTFNWSYTPDFSGESFGFYGKYYDAVQKRDITYSKYLKDGGGSAPQRSSQNLSYGFVNKFECKVAQQDTVPDKNVELLTWNINGSVDLTADSLQFTDVSMGFRIPTIENINLNANANFTLYDQAPAYDNINQKFTNNVVKINKFLAESGKGLMRLTNFTLYLSTNISSDDLFGTASGASAGSSPKQGGDTTKKELELGERFQSRMEYSYIEPDYFGDRTPGYSKFGLPWTLGLNLNYSYSKYIITNSTESINLSANLSLRLTPSWILNASAQYNFDIHEIVAPSISITKDMHCWALVFNWYPIGYNQGFFLKFGVKAQQLQDLFYKKESNPILR